MSPSAFESPASAGDVIRALGAQAIHDDVVQDLAIAALALDTGDTERARQAVGAALERSRRLVGELLEGLGEVDWLPAGRRDGEVVE